MKKHSLIAIAAAAVLGAAVLPATPAFAADATVNGSVTLDGAPLGGVEVGWYDPTTDAAGETVADATGAYALTVPDGHPYVLYAGIDRRADNPVQNHGDWEAVGGTAYVGVFAGSNGTDYLYQGLSTFTGSLTSQNIDLDKPGEIAGTNPLLANKRIALERTDGSRLRTVKADATGHFLVQGLTPGSYRLSAGGYPSKKFAAYLSPTLAVAAGAVTTADPQLVATGTISGVVTNKGKPVKGVSVSSFLGSSYGDGDVTDAKGRYTLTGETPGTYDIYLENGSDDGSLVNRTVLAAHRTATVTSGTTTKLNIAARKGGSVTGTIPATKAPGVQVWVVDTDGTLAGGRFVETSKKKATPFTIKAVDSGRATVYVTTGYQAKTYGSVPVTVKAGIANSVGTIALTKKTVTLSGKVSGVSSGTVGFSTDSYGLSIGSAKISKGSYRITGLLPVPGTVSVNVTAKHLGREYAVTPGGTKNVALGPVRPTFAATFTAGLYPLRQGQGTIWLPGESASIGSIRVTNGVAKSTGILPGTGYLKLASFDTASPFVYGSPFWYSVPKSVYKIILKNGALTDLGTVPLVINR